MFRLQLSGKTAYIVDVSPKWEQRLAYASRDYTTYLHYANKISITAGLNYFHVKSYHCRKLCHTVTSS